MLTLSSRTNSHIHPGDQVGMFTVNVAASSRVRVRSDTKQHSDTLNRGCPGADLTARDTPGSQIPPAPLPGLGSGLGSRSRPR